MSSFDLKSTWKARPLQWWENLPLPDPSVCPQTRLWAKFVCSQLCSESFFPSPLKIKTGFNWICWNIIYLPSDYCKWLSCLNDTTLLPPRNWNKFTCILRVLQPPNLYQGSNSEQPSYMALRTTTTRELGDYDNPNKMFSGHGYDVPKGTHAGYEAPNRHHNGNGGKVCACFLWIL